MTLGVSGVCNTQSCFITAPTSMTIPPGTCGTNVTYSPPVSFVGACGVVVVNPPTGTFFGIGTKTVLVRGTRADSSFTDASFPVTVQESETQATGLGANVTNNFCNTTVTYTAVTGAGSTTVVDAPAQILPAPFTDCPSCPQLNITTTSPSSAPVTECITMPASTDFDTFSALRILHFEGAAFVERTFTSSFATKQICAQTSPGFTVCRRVESEPAPHTDTDPNRYTSNAAPTASPSPTVSATPCTPSFISGSNNTPLPIPTTTPPIVITSTITIAGAQPYLLDVNVTANITHTFNGDIDMTVMSPAGTIVTITSDNAGTNANVFAGTTWDDDANPGGQVPYVNNNGLTTDHLYADLVTVPLLAPEEALAAFIGENPNGVWTLTLSDDANQDGGSFQWLVVEPGHPAGSAGHDSYPDGDEQRSGPDTDRTRGGLVNDRHPAGRLHL